MDIINIEPLKTIIDLTTDKRETIMFFLSTKLKILLEDYELVDDNDFYLNDYIVLIKRNNLTNEYKGKIICINESLNKITIKNNNYNVTIDPEKYYIFIKPNTSKNNDRQFFKSLLEKL